MTDEKIARINELYHKSKGEGLTEAEKVEQQVRENLYKLTGRAPKEAKVAEAPVSVSADDFSDET